MNAPGVVIIASLEGGYFYYYNEIMDILRGKNIKIISLTMNNNSYINKISDEIIVASKHNSDTEGRISLLFTLELLLMHYAINYQMFT